MQATSSLRRLPKSHTYTKLPVASHRPEFSFLIIPCSKYNSLAGDRGNSQSVPQIPSFCYNFDLLP